MRPSLATRLVLDSVGLAGGAVGLWLAGRGSWYWAAGALFLAITLDRVCYGMIRR